MNNFDWDFISLIIEVLNYFVIITSAIFAFFYFKIKKLKIISIKDDGGYKIIVQNISKNAVFVKNITVIIKNNFSKYKKIININDLPDVIESKSYYKFILDCAIYNIEKDSMIQIKTELYPKYIYKKRIK